MITRKAQALREEERFNLLKHVRCDFSSSWYKGLKKEFGWTKVKETEKRKTAELDEWSRGLTQLHPSALKRATVQIWGYEKDEKFLRHWLRRNGFTLKNMAKQNTLYIKTRKSKKKVNLKQYFAAK